MLPRVRTILQCAAAILLFSAGEIRAEPGLIGQGDSVFELGAVGSLSPRELADMLVGCGIEVTDVRFIGTTVSAGAFTATGTGVDIIGFSEGLILSSGSILSIAGPNDSDSTSTNNGLPGDADLDGLITQTTYDATILEFDFIPSGSEVTFDYVFSSDEYNEFVNTTFNDVFAFFLNGQNVALLPGTTTPVAVNTVNNGNPIGTPPISGSEYYIDNAIGTATVMDPSSVFRFEGLEMDGLTVVFTVTATVMPGQINRIKFAIADAGDSIYDSNVFIRTGSFSAGGCGGAVIVPPTAMASASGVIRAYPNPFRPGSGGIFDAAHVQIADLPPGALIRIYSMNGELVAELADADNDGVAVWDAKNRDGQDVASGVYAMVAVASPPDGEKITKKGKIVVIR